jgi:hypothetical protein
MNEEALAHWGAVAPKQNKNRDVLKQKKIVRYQKLGILAYYRSV